MRMWLLLILLVCLAGALLVGNGSSGYEEKSEKIISQMEDL